MTGRTYTAGAVWSYLLASVVGEVADKLLEHGWWSIGLTGAAYVARFVWVRFWEN